MLPELLTCIVIAIADSDTLTARCDTADGRANVTVRLAEIDAPERAQAFGNRSKQHLAELCFQNFAMVTPRTTDRYGRTVARVECDGIDANVEQVRAGMAWAFTKYLTDPAIKVLEDQAHEARLGLWRDAEPVAPWEWRHRRGRQPSR